MNVEFKFKEVKECVVTNVIKLDDLNFFNYYAILMLIFLTYVKFIKIIQDKNQFLLLFSELGKYYFIKLLLLVYNSNDD